MSVFLFLKHYQAHINLKAKTRTPLGQLELLYLLGELIFLSLYTASLLLVTVLVLKSALSDINIVTPALF